MATQSPYRPNSIEPYHPASPLLSFYRQANRLFEDVFREFDSARDTLGGVDTRRRDPEIRQPQGERR